LETLITNIDPLAAIYDPTFEDIGDFHIYQDGRPMSFVKA
jgi:hypothetical protein